MSAVALGYPMPTILNWHGEYNRPEWHFKGSHIAKLESLLGAIETLLDTADDVGENDVAVLVDAYDIWFQLPPRILLQRFHALNREADARVREQWASAPGFPVPPPRQEIIITAAKDCFPTSNSGSDAHYEHWPDSPMPDDLYGPDTDVDGFFITESARTYRRRRPRCVNSGMIMGTMGALRDALRRARDKVEVVARSGRQLWSDQALFAEVIGDQELMREWLRAAGTSWDAEKGESLDPTAGLASEVRDVTRKAFQGVNFEFGIGIDYNFTTIPPTCSAEDDGYFIRTSDAEEVQAASDRAGVPTLRVHGLDGDVAELPDDGVSWADVPLYTDFFMATAPVGIHHNAYIFGLKKKRLVEWWDKMWFYPRLRELVTRHLKDDESKGGELAVVKEEGEDVVYYRAKDDVGEGGRRVRVFEPTGARGEDVFGGIGWDDVCQGRGAGKWHEELFRDGKGEFVG